MKLRKCEGQKAKNSRAGVPRRSVVRHNFLAARCDEAGDDADVGAGGKKTGMSIGEQRVCGSRMKETYLMAKKKLPSWR